MKKQMHYQRLLHGGDYNPEQWLDRPDILAKDIEYFKKAHINTVSVGIFSWAMLEPEEGRYEFDWLESVINNLYENGISVILATPSGARPKWLSDKYPEVLRVDENRNRNLFGGRHNHCYTSPIYREKISKLNSELSRRFGNHPAVILWHISNELGGECHCPLCQHAFQEWLREKYNNIENLNQKWSTTFWSHRYNCFEQIESPSPRGESALHALNLEWKRFVTKQTLEFVEVEKAAILAGGSAGKKSLLSSLRSGGKADESSMSAKIRARIDGCVICEQVDKALERYAYTIAQLYFTNSEFKGMFERSKGFCLPHLALVLELAEQTLSGGQFAEFKKAAAALELENLRRVEGELEWFTLKFDYRNDSKPWGNSKDAPDRAINKLMGACVGEEAQMPAHND